MADKPKSFPPQEQDTNPGKESEMNPPPQYSAPLYKGIDNYDRFGFNVD